jgi:hypothetical protein
LVALASPFVATLRELREMKYLWDQPVRMSNSRLSAVLGQEPHTPWDEAVEATLEGLGCLATPGEAGARKQVPTPLTKASSAPSVTSL